MAGRKRSREQLLERRFEDLERSNDRLIAITEKLLETQKNQAAVLGDLIAQCNGLLKYLEAKNLAEIKKESR